MGVPRLVYSNVLAGSGVAIVPGSEEPLLPRAALARPHPTDIFRWKQGRVDVRTGENDGIDVRFGSDFARTLAAGSYDLAGAATAAQTALTGVPLATWVVTYNTGTHKYSIQQTGGVPDPFQLLGATGTGRAKSVLPDLGYTMTDKAPATTITAESAVYHSRRVLHVDMGAARDVVGALVRAHNGAAGATFQLDGSGTTLVGTPYGTPGTLSAIVDASGQPVWVSTVPPRYLRLVMSDVGNPLGYGEVGVLFPGGSGIDLPGFKIEMRDIRDGLSRVIYAVGGAQYQLRRGTRKVWRLTTHNVEYAKKAELDAFNEEVKAGGAFFFSLDTDNPNADPYNTRYVFMEKEVSFAEQETDPRTWEVELELLEVMG